MISQCADIQKTHWWGCGATKMFLYWWGVHMGTIILGNWRFWKKPTILHKSLTGTCVFVLMLADELNELPFTKSYSGHWADPRIFKDLSLEPWGQLVLWPFAVSGGCQHSCLWLSHSSLQGQYLQISLSLCFIFTSPPVCNGTKSHSTSFIKTVLDGIQGLSQQFRLILHIRKLRSLMIDWLPIFR